MPGPSKNYSSVQTTNSWPETIGDRIITVGPDARNHYQELSTALNNITASQSDPATVVLTGSITDSNYIHQQNHVDIHGNGHRVEINGTFSLGPGTAAGFRTAEADSTVKDLTIDYTDSIGGQNRSVALWVEENAQENIVFQNVDVIANPSSTRYRGILCRHKSRCTFENVRVPLYADQAGNSNSAFAIQIKHNSYPTFRNCTAWAGQFFEQSAWKITGGAAPTLKNCVGVTGHGKPGPAWELDGRCAPIMQNCTGRPSMFALFANLSGTDSVTLNNNLNNGDIGYYSKTSKLPGNLRMKTMTINVITAGAGGSTLDIGTSAGASDVASGVPTDSQTRVDVELSYVRYSPSDTLHFTPTDTSIDYRPRAIFESDRGGHGLWLKTGGKASITNSLFRGAQKPTQITGNAMSSKEWHISNCVFELNEQDFSNPSLELDSDGGANDPIYNCVVRQGATNLHGMGNVLP